MEYTNPTFEEWLYSKYLDEELSSFDWNPSIRYMPIESVRKKIEFMRTQWKIKVNYYDVCISSIITPDKDVFWTGTIRAEIILPDASGAGPGILYASLNGAATFSYGQYAGKFTYGQIAKSLAIVNAFSSEYPQFGKGINKEDDYASLSQYTPIGSGNNLKNALKNFGK